MADGDRSAAGVVGALFTPLLCLNLIENGVDPLFVQQQVGAWASTAAVYTQVGAEAKNRMLRAAFHEPWTQADGRIYINVPQWSVTMFRLL